MSSNKGSEPLDNPLVSIITVVFNGEQFLEKTIQSVIEQWYTNIEYIIIDGGSTDGTLDIIKKYSDKITRWMSEKDEGIYDAMNKGLSLANGTLIGIINSDDFYPPNAIFDVVQAYGNSNADIIYGDMELISPITEELIEIRRPKLWKMYFDMYLNHPAVFMKKSIYDKRKFNVSYRLAADYELLLYLKLNKFRFIKVNKILAHMRSGGISEVNYQQTKDEVYLVKKRLLSPSMFLAVRLISFISRSIR